MFKLFVTDFVNYIQNLSVNNEKQKNGFFLHPSQLF